MSSAPINANCLSNHVIAMSMILAVLKSNFQRYFIRILGVLGINDAPARHFGKDLKGEHRGCWGMAES